MSSRLHDPSDSGKRLAASLALCLAAQILIGAPDAYAEPAFTHPAVLNTNAPSDSGDDEYPQIASDGAGTWISIWTSDDTLRGVIGADADILFSVSSDNGRNWSAPAALNSNAGSDAVDDINPQLATDRDGAWIASWGSGDYFGAHNDILYSVSTNSGTDWSVPTTLTGNPRGVTGHYYRWWDVAADGAGNWLAAWSSYDVLGGTLGNDVDILYAMSTNGGTSWSAPAALNTNAGTDTGADWGTHIATDGGGVWVAVWTSEDTLDGTIGWDADILCAVSTDNGVTWSEPAPVNSDAETDGSDDDTACQLATDGMGTWIAVWKKSPFGSYNRANYAVSTNNGASWSVTATLDLGEELIYGSVQLATDEAGMWIATWESQVIWGHYISEGDIGFTVSTDNGTSWSAPRKLNTDSELNQWRYSSQALATDGAGTWIAVCQSRGSIGSVAEKDYWATEDYDIMYSVWTPESAESSRPSPLNTNVASDSGQDDTPHMATDGAGTWISAWSSSDSLDGTIGEDYDILFSVSGDGGTSWGPPTVLNSNAADDGWEEAGQYYYTNDFRPEVVTDGAGTWIVIWYTDMIIDYYGGILYAVSTDAGANWSETVWLDSGMTEIEGRYHPHLATDGAGTWIATWISRGRLGGTFGEDSDVFYSVSTDAGTSWSDGAPLNGNAATDTALDAWPRLATDGEGRWICVWMSTDNVVERIPQDWEISYSVSTDGGASWGAAAVLNSNAATDTGSDLYPRLDTDGAGTWIAIWQSVESLGGTIGTDADILFAVSADDGDNWSAPAPLNTNAATDSWADIEPHLTTDRAGTWVATWSSFETFGGTIGTDGDILTATSTDNGGTWSAPAILNDNASEDTGRDQTPQVTTDGMGTWIAAWTSDDSQGSTIGSDRDIMYEVLESSSFGFDRVGALNTNAGVDGGSDYEPQMATDGNGLWISTWYSNDSLGGTIGSDYDILYSVSADDGASWSAPAALNANAATDTGHDYRPQIASTKSGAVIDAFFVVWSSTDSLGDTIGTDHDILYTMSIDGGTSWMDPAPLNTNAATDSGADAAPQITCDSRDYMTVVWHSNDSLGDTIGTDWDILISVWSGGFWSAPAAVALNAATDNATDYRPQLESYSLIAIVVWQSDNSLGDTIGADFDILWGFWPNILGAMPMPVNSNAATDSGDDFTPQVTCQDGPCIVVWESNDSLGGTIGTDFDVLHAELVVSDSYNFSWTAPAPVNRNAATDSAYDGYPQLTTSGGVWVATWESTDSLGGTIGGDYDVLYSVRTNLFPNFTPPRALNANAATDTGMDLRPQLVADGAGGWIAAWQSTENLGGAIGPEEDILYSAWSPAVLGAPVINEVADVSVDEGSVYRFTPTLSQGASPVTWSLTVPASPPGDMAVDSGTGEVTWTAVYADSPVYVTLRAENDDGFDTESWRIDVASENPLSADVWVDRANVSGVEDGTAAHPYRTVTEGYNHLAIGGTLHVVAGDYAEAFTVQIPSSVTANGGTVRIGVP